MGCERILSNIMTGLQVPEPDAIDGSLLPQEPDSFWEGVQALLAGILPDLHPALTECVSVCLGVLAVVLLISVVQSLPGNAGTATELAGAAAVGTLLLRASNSLISLGAETVRSLSEYGKMLLPVMTAALAGSGGSSTSAALYAGTTLFDAFLTTAVSTILIPMIYVYLCLCVVNSAIGEETLKKLSDFIKWLLTWCLKIVLYLFTGFVSITGVVSGSTDAAAMKAAKLTISGVVPVVGNILSDASEAVLVGAGVVKNASGLYGMLAVLAIWLRPFLLIGVHYLLMKATAGICSVFGTKNTVALIRNFSSAMGLVLAMTGTGCLMLLISLICFMKGVG